MTRSTVIEYLRKKYESSQIAATDRPPVTTWYCSGARDSFQSDNEGEQSGQYQHASGILRSFLRQYGYERRGFDQLAAEYGSRSDRQKGEVLQLKDLKRLLKILIQNHDQSFIVLDALDECEQKRFEILSFFKEFLGLPCSVKIFVSARVEQDIEDHLRSWKIVKLNEALTRQDLELYVENTIRERLSHKSGVDEPLLADLRRTFRDKAGGK